MTQPAKVQEPSMEEILASIRRIIADDEAKPAQDPKQTAAQPQPEAAPMASSRARLSMRSSDMPHPAAANALADSSENKLVRAAPEPAVQSSQDDIDALLAGLDAETSEAEVRPAGESDVLELTEQMTVADKQPFQAIEGNSDIEFSEIQPSPPPASPKPAEPVARPSQAEESSEPASRPLLSQSTVSAVDSAFNSLAQTVLSNNARTLEDLVKEMLRPLLKGWLDDNLPGLVEKIVRAEIERVSRGR